MKKIRLILAAVLLLSLSACAAETQIIQPNSTAQPDAGMEEAVIVPAQEPESGEGEAEKLSAILSAISTDVMPGSAGSSLRGAAKAAMLLDWAAQTSMSPEEARSAAVDWLSPQGNDAQTAFSQSLLTVDSAYQQLIEDEGAQELLSSAGCTDSGYPWSEAAVEIVEGIMGAAGLR